MVENMAVSGSNSGRGEVAEEGDLDAVTLDANTYKAVWSQTGKKSEFYWVGNGIENQDANVGRLYADIQSTPDGGTTINATSGTARFVVFEDPDMDYYKAVGPTFSLGDLRDAVADNRTERPMLANLNPGASEDEVIALEVKGNDGETVSTDNCDVHIPYTALRV